ncbi:type 2 lantipeptide synthetase LanM family protein [Virgibacillus pantothenticus]|uniref:type 2 lanthipeptide synthetase LanM family protein n=1 Tax=Virgibacillus pantothenticus TaxID=1473 RepID=UPI001C2240EE|nr:type 2 lanthipeptide synthetase LanM family protein [Virgibacillus pantothenticus]MBU8568836.1 type 2 lantipeptide synthetase LanM family protein [Virgibacillus pantothenticus]MBU8602881.1 type 2 lantipeptide synthetase LanM family protein [Virgibacillus pantothenticus]MBU8636988.1 type 2 lantipeptide synthetase LanM family protein [Virgibacillus pantothenticus]MBU8644733.1 type 2 lantipeptide synthetase LanM family protein [Virgibacillus pantothenticus]MBU8648887.1 type 2 lantipeptide synt
MSNIISIRIYEHLFSEKIDKYIIETEKKFSHILSSNYSKDIKNMVIEKIEIISGKFMLEDFHENSKIKKEKNGSKNAEINYYINKLDLRLDKFKNLRCILDNNIANFLEYYHNLMENFCNNREEIFPNQNVKINYIVVDKGDTHNNGKTVVVLFLNNGTKLVYKPRNLESDIFYYKLIQKFNYDNNSELKIPKIYNYNSHAWQEFIEYTNCNTIKEIETYYYHLGIHIFYTYMLRSNDIHYENIISNSNNPVIIDLETIMQGTINFNHNQLIKNNPFFLNDSILQSLLFDYATSFTGEGITFLGGTTNQTLTSKTEELLVDKNTNNMRYVYKEFFSNSSKNIPKYKGKFMEIYSFKEEVVRGFNKAYLYIVENKKKYKQILSTYPTFNVRYVLKPTYTYATYIEFLKQSHSKDNTELYNILQNSNVHYNSKDIITDLEYKSLLNYDVPYFTVNIDKKDIKSPTSNEKVAFNFFDKKPREEALLRIDKLSLKDLEEQSHLLDLAIDAYKENSLKKVEVHSLKKLPDKKDINHEIEKLISNTDNFSMLLSLRHNSNGEAIISPIGYNLYDGLGGIALLLSYWILKNKKDYSYSLKEINNSIENLYKIDKTNNFSIYHGKFSYFKYIYIFDKISEENQINENVDNLLKLIQEYNTHIANSSRYPIDYIGGLAGIISLLIDYYTSTGHKKILYAIENLKDLLLSKSKVSNDEIFWDQDAKDLKMNPGLAHGTSGIALTLAKYVHFIHKDEQIIYTIEKILLYEDKALSFEEPAIWCNGLSGILLARILIQHYIPYLKITYMEELIEILCLDVSNLNNRKSVCHGTHGNMLVLKAIESLRGNSFPDIEKWNKGLRIHTISYSWDSGFSYPNNNPGFFLGKSGQLFDIILNIKDYKLALYMMS